MHHQALSICLLRNKLTCLPILPLCPRSAILWLELVAIAGSVVFFFPVSHNTRLDSYWQFLSRVYASIVARFESEGHQSGHMR